MMSVQELLAEFKDAIEEEDYRTAQEIAEEINALIGEIHLEEKERTRKIAISQNRPRNERLTLREYTQTAAATDVNRSGFLIAAATFLSDPEEQEPDDIIPITEQLQDTENQLSNRVDEVNDLLEEDSFPPILLLSTTVPEGPKAKGSSITVSIRTQNVGDDTAEEVQLQANSEDSVTVEPADVTIGTLNSSSDSVDEFDIGSKNEGTVSITFKVLGDNTDPSSSEITLKFIGKSGLTKLAKRNVEEMMERLDDSDIPRGRTQSQRSKLETAYSRLEDAIQFIEGDQPTQADNMLTAASNALNAFLNQSSSASDNNISNKTQTYLENKTIHSIKIIETATTANI